MNRRERLIALGQTAEKAQALAPDNLIAAIKEVLIACDPLDELPSAIMSWANPPQTCWCCGRIEKHWESGLCLPCYTWVEDAERAGVLAKNADEATVVANWRAAMPHRATHWTRQGMDEKLRALGWKHGQTGGGCTAYTKNLQWNSQDDPGYYMMTVEDDACAPAHAGQRVSVGVYDKDGIQVASIDLPVLEILEGSVLLHSHSL